MQKIFICQIVDFLSKKVTHTFMAASHEHAVRQFKSFLKSLEGKIDFIDFSLLIVGQVDVCDSFDSADSFVCQNGADVVYIGSEVMSDEG